MQVILKQLDVIEDQVLVKTLHKKMAAPLVTLLSAESEIQYVVLKNINLVVQKYPQILAHEVKVRSPANKKLPTLESHTFNPLFSEVVQSLPSTF